MTKWLILTISLTLTGCASTSGNEAISNQDVVAKIKRGATSKQDILQMFGEPGSKVQGGDDAGETEIWNYNYLRKKPNPWAFVPLVNIGVYYTGNVTTKKEYKLAVNFDQQGIVRSISYGQPNEAGMAHSQSQRSSSK